MFSNTEVIVTQIVMTHDTVHCCSIIAVGKQ